MPTKTHILAWHFTAEPGELRNGEPFSLGKPVRVKGEIVPCKHGLHGSPSVLDALKYAPGPHLYRVELHGTIVPHGDPVDKYAASMRTATEYRDATPLLQVFARQCALDVLHLWDAPPIVREYLLTSDESKRDAARDAASAAWGAASAARDAASAAAWYAARDAASAAASAARDAASAAWGAAWYAASATRDAARDAASAAWGAASAAWDAQRERLETWSIAFMKDGAVPEVVVR